MAKGGAATHVCLDCGRRRDRRAVRCNQCASKTRAGAWSESEKQILREAVLRGLSNREIAACLPSRSVESIKNHAIDLGYAAERPRGDRLWTAEEDQLLVALRETRRSQHQIAAELDRTVWAVTNRIRALGLPRLGPRDLAQRFWEKVDRRSPDECWLWTAALDRKGYGYFAGDGRAGTASRWAYILTHGDIPGGLCVRHDCDNPPCCNPAHLRLGTLADNNRDMSERGRVNGFKPGSPPSTKLTAEQVGEIKVRLRAGEGQSALARVFGVNHRTVHAIARGHTWRHVA